MFSQQKPTFKLNIEDAEIAFRKHIEDFALVKLEPPHNSLPHHHTFFEMIYVIEGTLIHSIRGENMQKLQKGDFVFIDIGTSHEFTSDDAIMLTVVFTPHFIDKKIQFCSSLRELLTTSNMGLNQYPSILPTDTVLHDDNDDTLLNLLKFLKVKFDKPQPLSAKIAKHCIKSILMHIIEPEITATGHTNPIIESLITLIDEHYNEPNLMTYAAKELNYTIPYLSAVFKNHFGISFKEYLQTHRINIAKSLLDSTNMSITNISSAVGYSNIKFFRSTFKKHTNMTPRQYKNTHYKGIE